MANIMTRLFGKAAPPKAQPRKMHGAAGRAIYSGYIQDNEKSADLRGTKKYETYGEVLANTSIVAAGVRYFLNLTASAEWSFSPSEADVDGRYAELAEEILTSDPLTSWHRVVRRAAMYRFYGFSVQEWQAMRRQDGFITFKDIAPRAQRTIERWQVSPDGEVLAMIQTSPQTSQSLIIPRAKTLYLVDDTLEDSPEGIGLFRHLVLPAQRLRRYEQLEGFGFETDLRGVPVGRGPFTKLAEMVENGEISDEDRRAIEAPMRSFVENHIKSPKLGLLLDSQTYESQDDASTPSSIRQWDVELLQSGGTSLPDMANAISRVNREMARVLGVEQLLLGEGGGGSYALGRDKTQAFFLLVDGALGEIVDAVRRDLLTVAWDLNGWDHSLMPDIDNEAVRFQDIEATTVALRDMAAAGAILAPDDPAITEVRDMLGLSHPIEGGLTALDAGLAPVTTNTDMPEIDQ